MKTIQIRDVPDEVHAALRAQAAAAGQSLSAYLLGEATRIARRPDLDALLRRASDRSWGVAPGRAATAVHEARAEQDAPGA